MVRMVFGVETFIVELTVVGGVSGSTTVAVRQLTASTKTMAGRFSSRIALITVSGKTTVATEGANSYTIGGATVAAR